MTRQKSVDRSPMRVHVNGRFLSRPITGVERYGHEMLRAIDHLCSDPQWKDVFQFVLVTPHGCKPPEYVHIEHVQYGIGDGHFWDQTSFAWISRGGVSLNLINFSPLFAKDAYTVIHDAHVWLIPENFSRKFRFFYRVGLPLVGRRSSRVLTVSEYSAKMLKHFKIVPYLPEVLYCGADHIERVEAQVARRRPFVFALGSRSVNKNIDVLEAIRCDLDALGIDLVISGGANASVFSDSGVASSRRLTDVEIAGLYKSCLCFAFPSLYEGFGIPPLEAMIHRAPVVASNQSAIPEILGDAALYCPPRDPAAWLSAVRLLHGDASLRAELERKGIERAAQFTWRRSAEKLLTLLAKK